MVCVRVLLTLFTACHSTQQTPIHHQDTHTCLLLNCSLAHSCMRICLLVARWALFGTVCVCLLFLLYPGTVDGFACRILSTHILAPQGGYQGCASASWRVAATACTCRRPRGDGACIARCQATHAHTMATPHTYVERVCLHVCRSHTMWGLCIW